MQQIYFYIIIFIAIAVFFRVLSKKLLFNKQQRYPYHKTKVLTQNELNFYNVLKLCVTKKNILCKVRLADIIDINKGENRKKYVNQILSKHIDFVITDDVFNSLLAIELDDSMHNTENSRKRDEFKNKALEASGIKLLRYNSKTEYIQDDITEAIKRIMQSEAK